MLRFSSLRIGRDVPHTVKNLGTNPVTILGRERGNIAKT
jgi:hypothetical protein